MSLHKHGSMIFVLGRMGNVCRVILYNNFLVFVHVLQQLSYI